jgi:starch-binding outer membrane protein, SusD/RagB family
MKNLKLYFGVLGLAAMLSTSCTKLETKESDSVIRVDAGGFKAGNPTEMLASAYKKMDVFADQANIYALGEHTSGQMIPPTRGVDWGDNGVWRTLDQHTWDATHSWVENSWNQLNERAYNMNELLASNPSAQQAAEAKFLRAFYQFHVMDYWGQVPTRGVNQTVKENPTVMTRTQAFEAIVKDLTEALPALTDGKPAEKNPIVTKAAANFLLAKLYLNKAVYTAANPAGPYTFAPDDMKKVIGYCDAITAAGFGLEDSYFNNFTSAASKENILSLGNGSPSNRWFMTLHYDQNPSGWNGFTTLADFYTKFDAKDQRTGIAAKKDGSKFSGIGKGFLVGDQFKDDGSKLIDSRTQTQLSFTPNVLLAGANTSMGYRLIKYHPADASQYILMRNGAAQMMKAEAQYRGGATAADAKATVDALRAKRGMGSIGTVSDDSLFDELGRETYWEGGARTDEIRFGKFLTGTGVTKRDPGTVLFPIPAGAVSTNPNLKQNTGY